MAGPADRLLQHLHRLSKGTATRCAADSRPDPLDSLSAREMLLVIDAEVQRLPVALRLPVLLCLIEGFSREEAARRLGWTPGSVKGRLERARALLQRRLRGRGLAPA